MINFYINKPNNRFINANANINVIAFRYQETGYWPIETTLDADALNDSDMTDEILLSAEMGSMFGWHVNGAKLAKAYAENKIASAASAI